MTQQDEVLAIVGEAAGALAAGVDHLQGQAQKQGAAFGADLLRRAGGLLPDGAEKWMNRSPGYPGANYQSQVGYA